MDHDLHDNPADGLPLDRPTDLSQGPLEYFQDSQDPYEDIDMITPKKVSGGSSSTVEAPKKKHWWECTVDDYSDVDVDPPSPLDAQTKSSKTNLGI